MIDGLGGHWKPNEIAYCRVAVLRPARNVGNHQGPAWTSETHLVSQSADSSSSRRLLAGDIGNAFVCGSRSNKGRYITVYLQAEASASCGPNGAIQWTRYELGGLVLCIMTTFRERDYLQACQGARLQTD